MTVVRARRQSGARTALRAAILGTAIALPLVLSGCGSSSSIDNGTAAITVTDVNGDFTTYTVSLTSIALTRTDGATPLALLVGQQIDFTRLSDLSELMNAPAIPSGTYTSVTFTIDYSAAIIATNVNGQSQRLTPVDPSGNAVGALSFTVKFDPANPLVITHGKSVPFALDFDLAASNTINLSASTPSVTVRPFLVATAKPTDTKRLRARGPFLTTDTGKSLYTINLRPFIQSFAATLPDLGAVDIKTTAQTYFNINGTVYTGSAGLAAMTPLPQNTATAAFGTLTDLSGIKPVFTATEVYAGSALENFVQTHVSGVVSKRSGNTLTIHGATVLSPADVTIFYNDASVTIGSSTAVTVDGQTVATPSTAQISVGQRVNISGTAVTDTTTGNFTSLDATSGLVRLQPTTAWGTLNSGATPTSLSLNLLSLGDYEPAALDFTGTGSASGSDATASNYLVSTGGIDESAVAASTLLKVDGLVNAYGLAPPDFNATAITPQSSLDSQLIVEWPNGTTAPFTSSGASGLVVDLTNANLSTTAPAVIRTGPQSQLLSSLPASPLITSASVDPNTVQLAIGSLTNGISVFNTASGFATQLGTTLNGSTAVHKLVATGRYDAGSNTFNATRINIVLQ